MNTPETDAVDWVYDVLTATTARAALTALGVVSIKKSEPGDPHANYIMVLFGGGEEINNSGLARVTVLVDIWSQEVMMGATTNVLARFTERIQLCRQLIRTAAADDRRIEVEPMSYPMATTEPDEHKKYFFNATLTVPIIVGGGI